MRAATPVEMRKQLEVVRQFQMIGLRFVPIPVKDDAHLDELLRQVNEILEEVAKKAEGGE